MHRAFLPDLPLLHDGDSFILTLKEVGTKCVRIIRILRFPHNQNSEGTEESFSDLDHFTKRAIIQQINRRCIGKTVITS